MPEPVRGREPLSRGAGPFRKALLWQMLPANLSIEDRFTLARDCGFEGMEAPPIPDETEAARMRAAAEKAGVRIHSVIYGGWHLPLSSPDASVRERGVKEVEAALRSARNLGADNILLVPAVVNAETRYKDAYTRSQRSIRRLIPLAEQLKVQILIEEVWNNFLLSPLEFAAYIDSFRSPWVKFPGLKPGAFEGYLLDQRFLLVGCHRLRQLVATDLGGRRPSRASAPLLSRCSRSAQQV